MSLLLPFFGICFHEKPMFYMIPHQLLHYGYAIDHLLQWIRAIDQLTENMWLSLIWKSVRNKSTHRPNSKCTYFIQTLHTYTHKYITWIFSSDSFVRAIGLCSVCYCCCYCCSLCLYIALHLVVRIHIQSINSFVIIIVVVVVVVVIVFSSTLCFLTVTLLTHILTLGLCANITLCRMLDFQFRQ